MMLAARQREPPSHIDPAISIPFNILSGAEYNSKCGKKPTDRYQLPQLHVLRPQFRYALTLQSL